MILNKDRNSGLAHCLGGLVQAQHIISMKYTPYRYVLASRFRCPPSLIGTLNWHFHVRTQSYTIRPLDIPFPLLWMTMKQVHHARDITGLTMAKDLDAACSVLS
ncbi:hypothetical protein VNO77_44733 [Canavalia gladiata]|uniref:Uncharacterized protein n=1 Tax=Canavalia gladiata TaxID=3824 RepID=A0AAN9JYM0_CANGL